MTAGRVLSWIQTVVMACPQCRFTQTSTTILNFSYSAADHEL